MVNLLNCTFNISYHKAEFIYNTCASWIQSKVFLLAVIPKYLFTRHPIVLTLRTAYCVDILTFKVVWSQVKKTHDKVSVFRYGTLFSNLGAHWCKPA